MAAMKLFMPPSFLYVGRLTWKHVGELGCENNKLHIQNFKSNKLKYICAQLSQVKVRSGLVSQNVS